MLTPDTKRQAVMLLQSNRLVEARTLLEQYCRKDRNDIESWIYLVQINARLGQPDRVETCCREIIRIQPKSHDAHYHMGCALMFQGKRQEAARTFDRARELKPAHAPTHLQSGHVSTSPTEALQHYQRAVELEPAFAEAHGALGAALVSCSRVAEAIGSFRQALRLNSKLHRLHSDLLFTLNYGADQDASAVFSEHRRWGELHSLPAVTSLGNSPDPDRRLRVGYVSPDLREHSVAYFFEPLLVNHAADSIETFCYAEVAQPDTVTQRLQPLSEHWLTTCGMSDIALSERIRADRIDILVDLAGHSSNNRLLTFSTRAAPVQVTYLGYPNTTGLKAVDYRLTDGWADPPGQTEKFHTEKLVRLPQGFLCYRPPADSPPVASLPATTRGHIAFGSFNNLQKMTPEVVALWAELLHAVPDSRLVLKNYSLGDPALRARQFQLFAECGIPADRLDLRGRNDTLAEHLASYGDIDVALDSFPYNGTTTTCEAMFMGVPVVTLAGDRHAARVSASLLTQVGLSNLIAETPNAYLRIATELAADLEILAQLRAELRQRMTASPLFDGKRFARDVEHAYRDMWRDWCKLQRKEMQSTRTP